MRMILAALSNRKAAIGLFIVVALVVMALIAPLLTDYNPARRVGRPHEEPSATHVLGTTRNGYDVFAQLTYGARTSLAVGFSSLAQFSRAFKARYGIPPSSLLRG